MSLPRSTVEKLPTGTIEPASHGIYGRAVGSRTASEACRVDFPARSYRSALAVMLLLPVVAAASAGADPARTVRLDGSVVPWARSSNVVRAAPAAERISFDVYLRLRDADAAEGLAYAV